MIIRIQSSEGTKRVEATPGENIQLVYKKAADAFSSSVGSFKLFYDAQRQKPLLSSTKRTLKGTGIHHGDMLFMHVTAPTEEKMETEDSPTLSKSKLLQQANTFASCSSSTTSLQSIASTSSAVSRMLVSEHPVDVLLSKEDGRIKGKRNPQLCHHRGNSKCIHCTDLDPWDEGYQKENNIKSMSFHTYLRRLKSGVDKGKFVQLSTIDCSIKAGCTEHMPWPKGICSACQPSAVTLSRQAFRHVDAVVFENRNIVENFLAYWRTTGHQRVGLMYGRYLQLKDVPLGIKAEVCSVYEPPQEGSKGHVKILEDDYKSTVDEIAAELGLQCLGWIFTDLVPEDAATGTVKHVRHTDTYFLSSHEVLTAASLQLKHPNLCALSPEGSYGSKFTTVIVTGDENKQVHMQGYQVSHQCEALVKADCIVPTLDCPQLAYIRESTLKQYVPDVFFKEKDEYGNEITKLGRPLPVEYLLLDLPVSTPNEPQHTFRKHDDTSFPVENRLVESHLQDFGRLSQCLRNVKSDAEFLDVMSDFHLLLYIARMEVLPLRHEMSPLLEAIKNSDVNAAAVFRKTETWATVEQLIESTPSSLPGTISDGFGASSDINGVAGPSESSSTNGGAPWTCTMCTYINANGGRDTCEMCQLPRP